MGVDSYPEIFTTLIGWQMYGVIWDVLTATGIAFLPFLGILIEHWRQGFVDGEDGGGATTALRAMEIDIYMALTVVVIACVPSPITTLNRADVFYAPPATTANPSPVPATGSAPNSTYGSALNDTPAVVQVPAWWYAVMAISAGVDRAVISGSGLTLADFSKVVDAAKQASIDDPQVRFEAERFYSECYVPARTKYFAAQQSAAAAAAVATYGADDPEWIGSHALLSDPALYASMYAEQEVPGWPFDPGRDRDQAGAPVLPTWGRPSCQEWWEGGAAPGLKAKVVAAATASSSLPSLVTTFGATLTAERRDDIVVQTALDKTRLAVMPDAYVPAHSSTLGNFFSSTAVMISGFMTTFFTWLATAVMKPSLPFVQSLLLMGIYSLLPLVLVLARYSIEVLVLGAMTIFTVKFWSVLWFMVDFLSDRFILAIYPDADSAIAALSSLFKIGDSTKAMLLNLVVMAFYVALPALWSGLMAMAGARVGAALTPTFGEATKNTAAAGNAAASLGAKGLRGMALSVRNATRNIREYLRRNP